MRLQPGTDNEGTRIYVAWDRSKTIKYGPASGKHYATYSDAACTQFYWWLKRSEIKRDFRLGPTIEV